MSKAVLTLRSIDPYLNANVLDCRLKDIDGEWHELESKALRREKEKKEKERARAAQSQSQPDSKENAPENGGSRDRDRKRPNEGSDAPREAKRPHIDASGEGDRDLELDQASGRLLAAPRQSSQNTERGHGGLDPESRAAGSEALGKG